MLGFSPHQARGAEHIDGLNQGATDMKTGTTPPDTRPSRTARAGVIIAAITIEAGTRSVPMIVGGYTALILAALGAGMTLKATQAGLQPELHAKIEWVYEGLTEAIYWFGYAALAIPHGRSRAEHHDCAALGRVPSTPVRARGIHRHGNGTHGRARHERRRVAH